MDREPVFYAHTLPGRPSGEWERLEHHLRDVAARAAVLGEPLGLVDWCRLAGAWHDLGKYSQTFQNRLLASEPDSDIESAGRVDHSTRGAQFATELLPPAAGRVLAYAIAGHHAGLADWQSTDGHGRGALSERLDNADLLKTAIPHSYRSDLPKLSLKLKPTHAGMTMSMLTRMIFSVLVDADRIETERFCNRGQSIERNALTPQLQELKPAIDAFMATKRRTDTAVNHARCEVLDACRAKATLPASRFFSLTVPTGGGKTLASMTFALDHAIANGLRRVIVAIPFTSIIDQSADVYRQAFGRLANKAILEHHSNMDLDQRSRWAELCSENWASPVILTTNVQLYETLFAAGASRCRKLHNISRSVIILDEAQTLPVEFLQPTLLALRELVQNYGCSIVLCTATQPSLTRNDDFKIGLADVTEIIDDVPSLFSRLKRVAVEKSGVLTPDELLDRLAATPRALCIVNTRPQASELFRGLIDRVGDAGCHHLSTFMCAEHRRAELAAIREALASNRPCRVISTQLVEAGVDVDFPVVFRAETGLDSLAQAAGRCNREGKLDIGHVHYFRFPTPPPPGMQRACAQSASELLNKHDDLLAPEAIRDYFDLHYWRQKHLWDKHEILSLFDTTLKHQFRTCEERFRIIREDQCPVIVPYNAEARRIIETLLRDMQPSFFLLRSAQKYIVGVRDKMLAALRDARVVLPVGNDEKNRIWILCNDRAYSPRQGLSTEAVGFDPTLGIL